MFIFLGSRYNRENSPRNIIPVLEDFFMAHFISKMYFLRRKGTKNSLQFADYKRKIGMIILFEQEHPLPLRYRAHLSIQLPRHRLLHYYQ